MAGGGDGVAGANAKSSYAFDAFISHARVNGEKAHAVVQELESRGVKCWIAPRDIRPGREYGEGIMDGILESRCLVLLLSSAANASSMVTREVERAVSLDRPVFTVRIEDVQPGKRLAIFVSLTQWIEAFQGSLADHMDQLVRGMRDDDVIAELTSGVRARIAQRSRPRWIAGVLGFVGLAGVVIATGLLTRSQPQTGTMPGDTAHVEMAKELGLDLGKVGPSDFNVSIREIMPGTIMLYVEPKGLLLTLARQERIIQFRVGSTPWRYLNFDGSVNANEFVGFLEKPDIEAGGPVELRLVAGSQTGPKFGPFVFDISLRSSAADNALALARASDDWMQWQGAWASNTMFFLQASRAIRSVRLGAAPDALTLKFDMPSPPKADASPAELTAYQAQVGLLVRVPFDQPALYSASTLYGQLEFIDGSLGPVARFESGAPQGSPAAAVMGEPVRVSDFEPLARTGGTPGTIELPFLYQRFHEVESLRVGPGGSTPSVEIGIVPDDARRRPLASQIGGSYGALLTVPPEWKRVAVELRLRNEAKTRTMEVESAPYEGVAMSLPIVTSQGAAPTTGQGVAVARYEAERGFSIEPVIAPPGTERIAYRFSFVNEAGQSTWTSYENYESPFDLSNGPATLASNLELLFQSADGNDIGTTIFALEPSREMIQRSWVAGIRRLRRELLEARRFEKNVDGGTIAIPFELEKQHPFPLVRVSVRSDWKTGAAWSAIRLVRIQDQAGKTLATITSPITPDVIAGARQPDSANLRAVADLRAILPADITTVWIVYELFDGSTTDPVELPVQ